MALGFGKDKKPTAHKKEAEDKKETKKDSEKEKKEEK
jgi:hypothetical protein